MNETIKCVVCGEDFIFEAGEREFFAKKGFVAPKRCPNCRTHKDTQGTWTNGDRVTSRVTCSTCGKSCTVPFAVDGKRPVDCKPCFERRKGLGA